MATKIRRHRTEAMTDFCQLGFLIPPSFGQDNFAKFTKLSAKNGVA